MTFGQNSNRLILISLISMILLEKLYNDAPGSRKPILRSVMAYRKA